MINIWDFLQCPRVPLYKSTKSLTGHNTITLTVFFLKHSSLKLNRSPCSKENKVYVSFHRIIVTNIFLFILTDEILFWQDTFDKIIAELCPVCSQRYIFASSPCSMRFAINPAVLHECCALSIIITCLKNAG